jgi:VanZ family protein
MPPNPPADADEPALPGAMRRPQQGEKALHAAQRSENDRGSPNSQADAGRPALPDASRRPQQGEKALHAAQRSENDRGLPIHQGEKAAREAKRSENDRGLQHLYRGVPSLSWPLALATICVIIYASLYPFADWRNHGLSPFEYLAAPLPRYWTRFDLGINVLGYAPLGFLLALAALRSGRTAWPVTVAVAVAALLSLAMETLQTYLPYRIPSNLDAALNALGALLGASTAWGLEKLGAINRWSIFRQRWFTSDARGALALLVLWPVALLFPPALPMGLGQVLERLEFGLAGALENTPFLALLPIREIELQPLVPSAELACVALGALIPCLLGYCVVRTVAKRAALACTMLLAGLVMSALSAALSYGPEHAWAWLDAPVQAGVVAAVVLAMVLLPLKGKGAALVALLAISAQLVLLNQAPESAYFAQTLQTWEQGRFIRFHGLAQWLGWLWPYAALAYLLARLFNRSKPERAA